MQYYKLSIVTFLLLLITRALIAQVINGRVTDATNHQPLPHTTIIDVSDSTGTATDDEGYFEIKLNGEKTSIVISHLGYVSQEVVVHKNLEFLNLKLQAAETNLPEVIVRASHINQKNQDVPGSVNIITTNQLERNDETIITPALNRLPGVYMHTGSLNTNRITIRGIGARTPYGTNKVRAYFDDIPLTTGEGGTTLEDIDISTIQRAEVIKGPGSSIYGAGLGGTINLSSHIPAQSSATIKHLAGSYKLSRTMVQTAFSGDRSQVSLTYADTHTDGYRQNGEYDRQSFVATARFTPDSNSMFSVLGTYTHMKAFIPSSIDAETYNTSPSSAAYTWLQSRGYEAYNKGSIGMAYHYDLTSNLKSITSTFITFRDADEPRPFDILSETTIAAGVRSRVIWEKDILTKKTSVSAGFEYFNDWHQWSTYENLYELFPDKGSVSGEILSDNKERRYYYNLFAQLNVQLTTKLALQAGLNSNRTSYHLTDLFADSRDQSGKYSFKTTWSPRVGIVYKITEDHSIYGTVSHGFSPPSVAETLTPEGAINTNIQPETGWNYEIGAKNSWWNDRLYTEVALYRMEIENLLVAQRTGPDTYVGVNAGKTIHEGLEALISFHATHRPDWSIRPFFSATLMNYKFEEFISDENDYSGNDLTGVPSKIFNLGVDVSSDFGLYFYSNYRYVGAIPLNDSNSIYSDSYALLNCKLGYQRRVFTNFKLDISAGINNLLDEKYASMVLVNAVGFGGSAPRYYYPGMPRNYYGSLALKYFL